MDEKQQETNIFRKGFFKKLWYSITKIEKYPEMATEGVGRAVKYLIQIVSILAIVLSVWMTYETSVGIKNTMEYLQNEFPNFSYKDGSLAIEKEEPIILESEEYGIEKIIVDTNVESEEKINEYVDSIDESGIVVLNKKALIKTPATENTVSYDYQTIFSNMQITEFNKQNIIDYATGTQIFTFYISLFMTLFIYSLIMYFMTTIWYVAVISIIGYITAWILKIRMRYAAIFNMSVYAISLSVNLNIIYLIVNMFVPFTMKYFQVMYMAVATIYLIAAIFIIKSDAIKKQMELMKIAEAEAIVKKEMEQEKEQEDKREKEEKKEKKENKKEDKSGNKDEDNGEEPQGSNA